MNAEDLRIGNLFIYEATYHSIISITETLCKSYWLKGNNKLDVYTHLYDDNIEPIQLTEEWLTKFGFENIDYGHSRYLINPDKTIRLIWNNGWLYPQIEQAPEMSSESTQVVSLDRIKYVHELQNLYYALTHEEL